METQQQSVSKRVARGRHLGRRYCKRHGIEYVPLYRPPRTPRVTKYDTAFTVKLDEVDE